MRMKNLNENAIDVLALDCQVDRLVCVFSDWKTTQHNVAIWPSFYSNDKTV